MALTQPIESCMTPFVMNVLARRNQQNGFAVWKTPSQKTSLDSSSYPSIISTTNFSLWVLTPLIIFCRTHRNLYFGTLQVKNGLSQSSDRFIRIGPHVAQRIGSERKVNVGLLALTPPSTPQLPTFEWDAASRIFLTMPSRGKLQKEFWLVLLKRRQKFEIFQFQDLCLIRGEVQYCL